MPETTTARPASRPAWLIDSADFWRLWFVGLVVFTVRWVETVAIGVFVYQQTGSAFTVAMMTMLRLLPMGLFGAFLGAMAERIGAAHHADHRDRQHGAHLADAGESGTSAPA